MKSVQNAPVPKNSQTVEVILGLAFCYWRFVPKFTVISKPLHGLVAKLNQQGEIKTDEKVLGDLW